MRTEREISGSELINILKISSDDISAELLLDLFGKKSYDEDPKYLVNDYFKLPTDRFNTKREVYTTIGIYIINLHLIQPRFSKIFGYINKPFTGDVIEDIEDKLSYNLYNDNITTDDMADYYNRVQWCGCDAITILSPSITKSVLTSSERLKNEKSRLIREHMKDIKDGNAVVAANIEKELIKIADEELAKDDDGYENFVSKSKVDIKNHYKTMQIMKGPLLNSYTGKYQVNLSNYDDGVSKDEYSSFADSSVIGSHARAINTAKGGHLAKQSNQGLLTVKAGPRYSDCKTDKYLSVYLYKEMIDQYMNRYILDPDIGALVELTRDNVDKYVNKTVKMRSPMFCRMEEPCYCNICLGNQPYLLGLENFGLAVSRISNKLMNMSLKKFHDLTIKVSTVDPDILFDYHE